VFVEVNLVLRAATKSIVGLFVDLVVILAAGDFHAVSHAVVYAAVRHLNIRHNNNNNNDNNNYYYQYSVLLAYGEPFIYVSLILAFIQLW